MRDVDYCVVALGMLILGFLILDLFVWLTDLLLALNSSCQSVVFGKQIKIQSAFQKHINPFR